MKNFFNGILSLVKLFIVLAGLSFILGTSLGIIYGVSKQSFIFIAKALT